MLTLCAASASAYALSGGGDSLLRPTSSSRTRLACSSVRGVPDDADGRSCLLLPYNPFPGAASPLLIGEVQLQEMEDDMECRTQLFLNADGTVAAGATDGPLPDAMCGFWQAGSEGFQMTLQRTFATILGLNRDGSDRKGSQYTVTRVYLGSVNPESNGQLLVEGRIIFYDEDPIATDAPYPFPAGDQSFIDSLGASAIGFFNIDANIGATE